MVVYSGDGDLFAQTDNAGKPLADQTIEFLKTRKKDRPFFPFSLGPRRCLGEYFSFLEMKVHLGLLLPRFRMRLADAADPGLELAINLRSGRDIFMRPERRADP